MLPDMTGGQASQHKQCQVASIPAKMAWWACEPRGCIHWLALTADILHAGKPAAGCHGIPAM